MAPEVAVPAFAQSVASPEPTSTTLASMTPWVEAVPGAATARSGNDSGAVATTSTVPGIQRNGTPKLSVSTESTPAALSFSTPQVTARSIAELPGDAAADAVTELEGIGDERGVALGPLLQRDARVGGGGVRGEAGAGQQQREREGGAGRGHG